MPTGEKIENKPKNKKNKQKKKFETDRFETVYNNREHAFLFQTKSTKIFFEVRHSMLTSKQPMTNKHFTLCFL